MVSKVKLVDGSEVDHIKLKNDKMSVAFIPALGGKIVSIQSQNGREYLSRSERPYSKRVYAAAYGDTEFDGIDECFPSLGNSTYPAEPWKDVAIPDHGEICQMPWSYEIKGKSLICSVDGKNFPYTFTRKATVKKNTLQLDYTVTNNSEHPFSFYYAFHPLFTGETGCTLSVADDTPVSLAFSYKNYLGKARSGIWKSFAGEDGVLLKDQQYQAGSKKYYKYYTDKMDRGSIDLTYANGDALKMTWPSKVMPYMAVWCSQGAVGGLEHIAPEPCTSQSDDIQGAYKKGECIVLKPKKSIQWRIELAITDADKK
ncbi:MAG: hypothetical protein HRU15_17160 [Planctomycetes bacterium]|nr:hypothetical protein [Planctomycetota bacterium]